MKLSRWLVERRNGQRWITGGQYSQDWLVNKILVNSKPIRPLTEDEAKRWPAGIQFVQGELS